MGPNVPNSRSEFSTCTDVDIVTSSRLKTSVKLAELIPWDDLEDDDAHRSVMALVLALVLQQNPSAWRWEP